jgi:hypothetical protein
MDGCSNCRARGTLWLCWASCEMWAVVTGFLQMRVCQSCPGSKMGLLSWRRSLIESTRFRMLTVPLVRSFLSTVTAVGRIYSFALSGFSKLPLCSQPRWIILWTCPRNALVTRALGAVFSFQSACWSSSRRLSLAQFQGRLSINTALFFKGFALCFLQESQKRQSWTDALLRL